MSDILDEPIEEYKENRYTALSYEKCKTAAIYFVLVILIGVLANMIYLPTNLSGIITMILFLLSSIYGGLGFVSSLKSIRYGEEDTIKKWLSSIVNLICISVVFAMILMNIVDIFRTFGF